MHEVNSKFQCVKVMGTGMNPRYAILLSSLNHGINNKIVKFYMQYLIKRRETSYKSENSWTQKTFPNAMGSRNKMKSFPPYLFAAQESREHLIFSESQLWAIEKQYTVSDN